MEKADGKPRGSEKLSKKERAALLYRNFNILGTVALGGAALIAPPAVAAILGIGAGINAVQAGAGEWAARAAKKSQIDKNKQ